MSMDSGAEELWAPAEGGDPASGIARFLAWLRAERGRGFEEYGPFWAWSVDRLEDFWQSVWDYYGVSSGSAPSAVLPERTMPGARWFPGARLNYAEHVLGRATGGRPAIVSCVEDRGLVEVSCEDLREQVGAVAAWLRSVGVGSGDRVAAYAGNLPETVVAMLATTSLGAVWTACAPDFGTRSVLDRFAQVSPTVLIAVDGYRFGGRVYDRRTVVRELLEGLPSVRAALLIRSVWPEGDIWVDADVPVGADVRGDADVRVGAEPFDRVLESPAALTCERVAFDHPLWILYSSGTTGVPKGIVHGHGGILLEHLKSLGLGMDIREGDRYFFYSSTSWMAWNYLVGGLLHGATIVLYDGSPAHPDPLGAWRVAASTRATTFGCGAAYVSACEKAGVDPGGELDLGALRTVIPTGSPLAPRGWRWLARTLGPGVRIDPIAGGTDVCTAFIGGSPLLPVRVGEIPCRWPGVAVDVLDGSGRSVRGEVGEFVVTQPMPSMPIGLWRDPDDRRYRETYFDLYPGVWRQGDWAVLSDDGSVRLLGRSDATLNRGGVRLGSAEIYAVVESEDLVRDSLVVGVELDDGDYYMPLFLVLADGLDARSIDGLPDRLCARLRAELSPRHVPDEILIAPAVPRTLTGKKLEVAVKRILQGQAVEQAVALGAVDAPDALHWYAELPAARRAAGGVR
jgi:acetoacetyl-CoA synthetase